MTELLKLEICCYDIDDVITAFNAGANRIEFCGGRIEGGLTASYGSLVELAQLNLPIDIHPIIRPRGGDFCYSARELRVMQRDILMVQELGYSGIVIGSLTKQFELDLEGMKKFIELAPELNITFHRAFDLVKNPQLVASQLFDLGIKRVLTSGQKPTAIEGIQLIEALIQQKDAPIIMAGSGVNSNNLTNLIDVGVREFHASATKTMPALVNDSSDYVSMGKNNQNEYLRYQLDKKEVQKMKQILTQSVFD